ncbi:MAG: GYD domain-containing protein [Chloroflexi bacterium]|nr:GYD domain-containing protein [Chloroflexota bacterium]
MPKFITYFTYTGAAAKALIAQPSDRTAAARALVESVGGQLDSFYWMSGHHDGFFIATLADAVTASALAAAAVASGALLDVETHQIFSSDEQAAIMTKAGAALAAYRPPTA